MGIGVYSKSSVNGCAFVKVSREASSGLGVLVSVYTTCAWLPPRIQIVSSASPGLRAPQDRMFPGCLCLPFGTHASCVCMHACPHERVWICVRGTKSDVCMVCGFMGLRHAPPHSLRLGLQAWRDAGKTGTGN